MFSVAKESESLWTPPSRESRRRKSTAYPGTLPSFWLQTQAIPRKARTHFFWSSAGASLEVETLIVVALSILALAGSIIAGMPPLAVGIEAIHMRLLHWLAPQLSHATIQRKIASPGSHRPTGRPPAALSLSLSPAIAIPLGVVVVPSAWPPTQWVRRCGRPATVVAMKVGGHGPTTLLLFG